MPVWILIIAMISILFGFCLSINVHTKCQAEPDLKSRRIVPVGLGSDVSDDGIVPPTGIGGYVADSEKLDANLSAPPRNITSAQKTINNLKMFRAIIEDHQARQDKSEKSDDMYFELQAAYPVFDKNDIPNELFETSREALHAWMTSNGYYTPGYSMKEEYEREQYFLA